MSSAACASCLAETPPTAASDYATASLQHGTVWLWLWLRPWTLQAPAPHPGGLRLTERWG